MKKMIILSWLISSFTVNASIDASSLKSTEPTPQEIKSSRACFLEVEKQGCRHPSEDHEHFRSCMSDVFSRLSPSCQKMFSELYGNKK
ncbi:MAG: hypothetical protein AB7I27_15850 [Bacteriovoracaceae bacterium]